MKRPSLAYADYRVGCVVERKPGKLQAPLPFACVGDVAVADPAAKVRAVRAEHGQATVPDPPHLAASGHDAEIN